MVRTRLGGELASDFKGLVVARLPSDVRPLQQGGAYGQAARDRRPKRPEHQEDREVRPRRCGDFGRRGQVGNGQPRIAEAPKAHVYPKAKLRIRQSQRDQGGKRTTQLVESAAVFAATRFR
jgi:hypothetical protein